MPQYLQGRYSPIHPEKYLSNPTRIYYRSSLELAFMNYLDKHPAIIGWSSEEIIVPYRDPSRGNKLHRYFPDFFFKKKDSEGKIKSIMVEIKPSSEIKPPIRKSRVTKRYITEAYTYARNDAKWAAARAYCKQRGWDFIILTEKEILGK